MFETDQQDHPDRTAVVLSLAVHAGLLALMGLLAGAASTEPEFVPEPRFVYFAPPEPGPAEGTGPEPEASVPSDAPAAAPEVKQLPTPAADSGARPLREDALLVVVAPPVARTGAGAEEPASLEGSGSDASAGPPGGGPDNLGPGSAGGGGGGIHSLGQGESLGYAKGVPRTEYPDGARAAGIEGTVRLRLLIGPDGRIVKARSPRCTGWARADRKSRRQRWHQRLCIEVVDGPEPLRYEALHHWGAVAWAPYLSGGAPVAYFANVESRFRLRGP